MADMANHAENQPWPSLEWASWIFDRASFVLIGSLVIGAAATIAIVWMGIVKEHHWDLAREHAGERIASLELETARANEGAAEANARAAEAKLALEKFRQPRLLSEIQISSLAEKLKPFAGTRFDAAVIPGDPEAIIFLSHITAMLETAGWVWVEWIPPNGPLGLTYTIPGKPNIGQQGFFGVTLQVNPAHDSSLTKPADALGVGLIAEGFEATLDVIENANIPNKDTVHVIVGRKRR